jgi:two-component system cell cycle response regulator
MAPRQKLLAIDDSPDIHLLLAARLRPESLELHQALTAEEGFQKALELQPDLVLLDVDLAGVSGFELCERLKADPRTADLAIIFVSGQSDVHNKVRGFDLGAVDYVTKPFDAAELRARVRAALRTKRYQDLLSVRAQVDGLTGAFNRAYLDRRLAEEISRCARYNSVMTVVLADLDHFKKINDTYGHPFGDRVLQTFAETMHACARVADVVCRYGGEEFTMLLPETRADASLVLVERIRVALSEVKLESKGQPVKITASWGIAESAGTPAAMLTPEWLLTQADGALYAAKHGGRDCAKIAVKSAPP